MLMTFALLLAAAAAVHGQSCGGSLIVGEVGAVAISSPNYPQAYGPAASCLWTITGPKGKALKFTSVSFALESSSSCSYDYIEIEGNRFCGSTGPDGVVATSPVTVRFVSDSSVNAAGFLVSVEAAAPISNTCGGEVIVLDGQTTSFVSPRWPANYQDNANCIWFVRGPADKALQFNTAFFDMEGGSCGYDFLAFSETPSGGVAQSLGTFCSTSGPNKLRSTSNEVTVRFKSDSSINKRGFNVTVKVDTCPGQGTCPNDQNICISSSNYCDGTSQCPQDADEQYCNQECGIGPIQPNLNLTDAKIVGGGEAIAHSWPWQVAFLTSSGSQICGATLINRNWVMTAAHCCDARSATPDSYRVRVGAHDLSNPGAEESSKVHELKQVIMHPSYGTSPATKFDYCLLELLEPAELGPKVVPACLATEADAAVGTKCFITGWGNTSPRSNFKEFMQRIDQAEAGKLPKDEITVRATNVLHQVHVNIDDHNLCNTAYGGVIQPNMLCASAPGHDTCQGDSGGPLVCPKGNGDAGFALVGVTSWGRGCAQPGYPGVYARITHVLPWIAETLASSV